MGFWLHLILDVLVAGVILAVFYLFLVILPQHRQFEKMQEAVTAETAVTTGDTVGDWGGPHRGTAELIPPCRARRRLCRQRKPKSPPRRRRLNRQRKLKRAMLPTFRA